MLLFSDTIAADAAYAIDTLRCAAIALLLRRRIISPFHYADASAPPCAIRIALITLFAIDYFRLPIILPFDIRH